MVAEIDELVGKRKRSQFIEEAIEERLKRERRLKAFRAVVGSLKGKGIPEWSTPESTVEWVHQQRQESDRSRGVAIEFDEDGEWRGFSWTHPSLSTSRTG
jgi:hypothetical protein